MKGGAIWLIELVLLELIIDGNEWSKNPSAIRNWPGGCKR